MEHYLIITQEQQLLSVQTNQVVSIPATGAVASYNVTPGDSGKTFLIPALGNAHALTINLPPVQAGLRYRSWQQQF